MAAFTLNLGTLLLQILCIDNTEIQRTQVKTGW